MKNIFPKLAFVFVLVFVIATSAQVEILTNAQVVEMTKAGIADDVILKKINKSQTNFDQSTKALIEMKNAGVSDAVMSVIIDKVKPIAPEADSRPSPNGNLSVASDKATQIDRMIAASPRKSLAGAKTISFEKSSINPSRQALEKELLKRDDWKKLNLAIERYKDKADLYVEIGFVPMSIISHRYVYRIYDRRSGTVIAAGETTSWGSLAKNLAQHISKSLLNISGS